MNRFNMWISEENKIYLQRCYQCGAENYAPMVAHGFCAFCGYHPSIEEVKHILLNQKMSKINETILSKLEKKG